MIVGRGEVHDITLVVLTTMTRCSTNLPAIHWSVNLANSPGLDNITSSLKLSIVHSAIRHCFLYAWLGACSSLCVDIVTFSGFTCD